MMKIYSFIVLTLSIMISSLSYAGNPPPASPTIIDVTAFITDIQNLDELNEQVQVDAILQYEWEDSRLAYDEQKVGKKYQLYQGDFQYDEVYEGWRPQVSIINEVGSPQIKERQVRVYPDGHVILKEHRTLTLETPMALQKFPFDKQDLKGFLIPFGFENSEVQLRVNPKYQILVKDYIRNNPQVDISEWRLKDYKLNVSDPIKQYYGHSDKISMLTLTISLDRKPMNIIWKVLLPLTLLVLAMWSIFWMNKEALSDRLNISFIGILSVIAYQFLVEGDMPRIDYFTFVDGFLLISFAILFSTIVESLGVYWLVKLNKDKAARNLDIFFRIIFPIIYVLLILLLYLILVA
ncbi:ligand-gated ion channel [Francisella adeliensis]|uniref:Ligand-gated ion channel n=1 Tax=Francisella adeliensis TaxID=2007306 RepID=A0A2Z4XX92_9GAMM|nr:ligand-gated ion channel [Francisella adeliensis]AXA33336.1 hypothetical protein CDH04_02420 [Francisella adeliensis]MBK2085348.1 ligand-gated ion channel [Francisella adeliensis]MBK2097078.1 ligand-gated ion channel [Francisella adeliensis]QIW11565.1 ligand-gated ion channel [Francisella adeliensis]QIW13440.1 ligand-gated ion channel [Francisella adeliensis]